MLFACVVQRKEQCAFTHSLRNLASERLDAGAVGQPARSLYPNVILPWIDGSCTAAWDTARLVHTFRVIEHTAAQTQSVVKSGEGTPKIMDRGHWNVPLNPLRAFAVAVRHRTFTAAAEEMNISQVAISRQISTLEDYLGVQLFERGARSVKLTNIGRTFGKEIAPLFVAIENATRDLLNSEREQRIHVRTYPTFAQSWLLPRLQGFYDKYPHLEVAIDTKVEPLDFRGVYLDAAIQLGTGEWRDSRAQMMFPERLDLVCSPQYAAKFNNFDNPQDLAQANLIQAKYRRLSWQSWARDNHIEHRPREGHEFISSTLSYAAARNGLGLTLGQLDLLEDELESGALVRPLNREYVSHQQYWIIWPVTMSVKSKTKLFIDWVLSEVGQPRQFFK